MKAVLLIDDDLTLIQAVRSLLEGAGLTVYTATNSVEAVTMLRAQADISLAFVELDLFDTLDLRKSLGARDGVKLIIHTRCSSDRVSQSGAELYLRKPTNASLLLALATGLARDTTQPLPRTF